MLKNSKNFWKEKQKKTISSAIFTLDSQINFWEPYQRFLQKIQNGSKLLKKKWKSQSVPLDAQKVVLTTSWSFLAESLKNFSLKIRKKFRKEELKIYISSAIFTLDTQIEFWEPCRRFLQKIQEGSKLYKKIQATNCSSGHLEGSFENFLKFFGPKSEKFLLKNRKISGKKAKKNFFSAIFTLDT